MKCPRCGTEEFYQGPNHRDGEGECVNPECYLWDRKSKKSGQPTGPPPQIDGLWVADGLVNCLCGSHHWIRKPDTLTYSCRTCGREISDQLMTMLKDQHITPLTSPAYINLQYATPERIEKGYINCPQCGSHRWQHNGGPDYQCRICGNICHQALLELFAKTQHEVFKEKFQRSGGPGQCDAGGMEPDLSSCRTGTEVERRLREFEKRVGASKLSKKAAEKEAVRLREFEKRVGARVLTWEDL